MRRSYFCLLIMTVCLALSLVACETADTAYHRYQDISEEGWQNRDTLVFHVDTIQRYGDYTSYLCLRTHPDYPYRYLSVTVPQTDTRSRSREQKTIRVEVRGKDGEQKGTGITYYVHEVPLFKHWLEPGDSVTVTVNHNMTREYMPYIMGVGVKLKR